MGFPYATHGAGISKPTSDWVIFKSSAGIHIPAPWVSQLGAPQKCWWIGENSPGNTSGNTTDWQVNGFV